METKLKTKYMTKATIPVIGIITFITLKGIIGANDAIKKQPVNSAPTNLIAFSASTPTSTKAEFCTRMDHLVNNSIQVAATPETVDTPVPLHCLEPTCGLGVYSKRENEDTIEQCSYCGAIKPEKE